MQNKPPRASTPGQHDTLIVSHFRQAAENFRKLEAEIDFIAQAADRLVTCLGTGGKVMFCGNGGSAADSQHLAAELMGRYLRDRNPLPALSLTVDTSALTAIGNDYGYAEVFARQLRGIGRKGDVLVGLSTSGNSENVLRAVHAAKDIGIASIALTGEAGGKLAEAADLCIRVPSGKTSEIQEMHIAIGHLLCGLIEDAIC